MKKKTGKELGFPKTLPSLSGNLSDYIRAVNSVPILSAKEEHQLLDRVNRNNDLEAAQKVVVAHLRFVVSMARNYLGYGLPLGDMIQEGNVGLLKAVKHFDVNREVRFVSYAVHWIKAEMHDYIIRNWRIVKIATTKAQRKLFFGLRSSRNSLEHMKNSEIQEMAKKLDVKPQDVRQMDNRFRSGDIPFDAPDDRDSEETGLTPEQYVADNGQDPARLTELDQLQSRGKNYLSVALENLDERSRDIIVSRHKASDEKAMTLSALAGKYGISIERVRQLEVKALEKMRPYLQPLLN